MRGVHGHTQTGGGRESNRPIDSPSRTYPLQIGIVRNSVGLPGKGTNAAGQSRKRWASRFSGFESDYLFADTASQRSPPARESGNRISGAGMLLRIPRLYRDVDFRDRAENDYERATGTKLTGKEI